MWFSEYVVQLRLLAALVVIRQECDKLFLRTVFIIDKYTFQSLLA